MSEANTARAGVCTHPQVSLIARPYAAFKYTPWNLIGIAPLLAALFLYFVSGIDVVAYSAGCLIFSPIATLVSRRLAKSRLRGFSNYVGSPDLVCFGNIEDFLVVADLPIASHEPYITQDIASYLTRTNVFVICILELILAWLFNAYPGSPGAYFLAMVIAVVVVFFISWYLYPVYYRVSPKKIEVLRSRPFSEHVQVVECIKLTDTRIECHFDKRRFVLYPLGDPKEKKIISFARLFDGRGFARKVFACAVADHSMPDLPEQNLLG